MIRFVVAAAGCHHKSIEVVLSSKGTGRKAKELEEKGNGLKICPSKKTGGKERFLHLYSRRKHELRRPAKAWHSVQTVLRHQGDGKQRERLFISRFHSRMRLLSRSPWRSDVRNKPRNSYYTPQINVQSSLANQTRRRPHTSTSTRAPFRTNSVPLPAGVKRVWHRPFCPPLCGAFAEPG